MALRVIRKAKRSMSAALAAFAVLFLLSGVISWLVWDRYYEGPFKRRIFTAVALGNAVTSAVGALMVGMSRR